MDPICFDCKLILRIVGGSIPKYYDDRLKQAVSAKKRTSAKRGPVSKARQFLRTLNLAINIAPFFFVACQYCMTVLRASACECRRIRLAISRVGVLTC